MEVHVETFGCKVNQYDSSLIKRELQKKEFTNLSKKSRIVVINSCAVTHEASKEALRAAKKIKQENPDNLVVLTGCSAQTNTHMYSESDKIDLVVGNSHKESLPDIIQDFLKSQKSHNKQSKVFKSPIFKTPGLYSGPLFSESDRTRVFVKIQDGCDSFCTFCIIPFARGKSRSLKIQEIVDRINKLLDLEDIQEVVLTGVHIGDYKDNTKDLGDLIQNILLQTQLKRIRLSSLEPVELTEKLLDCYTDDRLCPHFHLSIQSASDKVLQAMKRQYKRKDIEEAFQRITKKIPNSFIGMDLIAGFPAETLEHFEETYHVLKENPWTRIHVFPYSPRPSTLASRSSGLSRPEILKRALFFRRLSDFRYKETLKKQVGTQKKVLLFKTNTQKGLSRDYWHVQLPGNKLSGEISVIIKGITKETKLTGQPVLR